MPIIGSSRQINFLGIGVKCRNIGTEGVDAGTAIIVIAAIGPFHQEQVVAIAAKELVIVCATSDRVITFATVDHVDAGIANQNVAVFRANEVLDIDQTVAFSIATFADTRLEIDVYACGRGRVVSRINAVTTIEVVSTRATDKPVISGLTEQAVIARAAIDEIIASTSPNRVIAVLAINGVDSYSQFVVVKNVVAAAKIIGHGSAGTADLVVKARTNKHFKACVGITKRIARQAACGRLRIEFANAMHIKDRKCQGHAGSCRCKAHGINAVTTIKLVSASTTDDQVIALAAGNGVGVGIARQCVVERRTIEIFD